MSNKLVRPATPPQVSDPPEAERELMRNALERGKARRARVSLQISERVPGEGKRAGPQHNDDFGWLLRLRDALGTTSDEFVRAEMDRLICALAVSSEPGAQASAANSALAVIDGIRPEDEVEAMLAGQMAVTHALAMDLVAQMKRGETLKHCEV